MQNKETVLALDPKAGWVASQVLIFKDTVAKVTFNEAAQTTEVTLNAGASYAHNAMGMFIENSAEKALPVKGTVQEVSTKLGL